MSDNEETALALSSLEGKERMEIDREVWGERLAEDDREEDDLVESLREFQKEVKRIWSHPAQRALVHANFLMPACVNDESLRMKMLRAEKYSASLAAARFGDFFRVAHELFGRETLVQTVIRGGQLNEEENRALEAGCVQLLPFRDTAGRVAIFVARSCGNFPSQLSFLRLLWKVIHFASHDNKIQKNGIVLILDNANKNGIDDLPYDVAAKSEAEAESRDVISVSDFFRAIPLRVVAVHCCTDRIENDGDFQFFCYAGSLLARLRVHRGSHAEHLKALSKYGIRAGGLDIERHRDWLSACRNQSQDLSNVVIPNHADVLFGRGKPFHIFPGTRMLATLASQNFLAYQQAQRSDKNGVLQSIYRDITSKRGGRFLKQAKNPEDGWIEVDEESALDKIGHRVRELRPQPSKLAREKNRMNRNKKVAQEVQNPTDERTPMQAHQQKFRAVDPPSLQATNCYPPYRHHTPDQQMSHHIHRTNFHPTHRSPQHQYDYPVVAPYPVAAGYSQDHYRNITPIDFAPPVEDEEDLMRLKRFHSVDEEEHPWAESPNAKKRRSPRSKDMYDKRN